MKIVTSPLTSLPLLPILAYNLIGIVNAHPNSSPQPQPQPQSDRPDRLTTSNVRRDDILMLRVNGGEEVAVPMQVAVDGRVGPLPSSAPTDISHALIMNSPDDFSSSASSSSSRRNQQRQRRKNGRKGQKQPAEPLSSSQDPSLLIPSSYTECAFWSPLSSNPSFISGFFGSHISLVGGISASPDSAFQGAEQVVCYDVSMVAGKEYAFILVELEGSSNSSSSSSSSSAESGVVSDVPGGLLVYRIEIGFMGRRFLGPSSSSSSNREVRLTDDPATAAAAPAAGIEGPSQAGLRVRRAAVLHQPHRNTVCSLITEEHEWLEFDRERQLEDVGGKVVVEGGCFDNS